MGEFLERINFKYYPHYPLDALNLYVAMLMDYAPLSLSLSLSRDKCDWWSPLIWILYIVESQCVGGGEKKTWGQMTNQSFKAHEKQL